MIYPHKCPVCEGRGAVRAGFYCRAMIGVDLAPPDNTGGGSSSGWPGHTPLFWEDCRSCQGRGYVLVSDRDQPGGRVGPTEFKGEGAA